MKGFARFVVLPLSLLGLAGCASTQQKSDAAFVAPQRAPSLVDADESYIARVEAIARRRGVEVVWINTPRKPAGRTD